MFPRITGENKHSQVRKQIRSAAAQTVKPSRSSTGPCLHKTISAVVALHHVPPLASPLTSQSAPVPRYPHCTSPARTIADSNASPTVAPHWKRAGCSTSVCTHARACEGLKRRKVNNLNVGLLLGFLSNNSSCLCQSNRDSL